ncbi:SRPBCC family protein [Chryseobacterium sp.]|uniref:SRPBCC family protein n=1 Tax=Chryseobacterium sp. TaxID=1871047 RepID=UPI0012A7D2D1|nr:SRPBCC family protein [Chryseobacterium sp.]QFG53124.1 SRPBCC family protein [Chryseobacterium sp.]
MPRIELSTEIRSSIEICFDLSRSVDLHKLSTAKTNEEAVAGKTSGLMNLNETVSWRATHFFIRQELTTKITALDHPVYFVDEQLKGIFRSLRHQHKFAQDGEKTTMTDIFDFESPGGILGQLFNRLILTSYIRKFLIERNQIIKEFAESDRWKEVLDGKIYK